jgi:diacylglycerol kinase family enzyme
MSGCSREHAAVSIVDPAQSSVVGADRAWLSRLWSAAALGLALLTVALAVIVAVTHLPRGLVVLACAVLACCAAWYGIRRRGWQRNLGLGVGLALLVAVIVLAFVWNHVLEDLLLLVLAAATLAATRRAFKPRARLPTASAPRHPVLFYNPKSGGGKAARFHLADEAGRRGIEAIELRLGEDLEELVRSAVARGADALAMAGGDGSQAIVAMVAAELDLPYACIPSGTRNHFALDLGVDRDDVVGALDAFINGRERRVDLAEVNGQVFVNNVSLGLYADAVARPGYREAKLHTLLDAVPDAASPRAGGSSLRWQGPDGEQSAVAILVSNNAYRLGRALGSGTRPRLDAAVLGVAVLAPVVADHGRAKPRWAMEQWTAPTFEIDADGPVAAGIDGESMQLSAPLRFRVRPAALRVRIAPHHPGASPSALEPDSSWGMVQALVANVLRGAPVDRAR